MNKYLLSLFTILCLAIGTDINAQDTTWVQTYTFEAQNNPETAYDSPGRRWFDFPEDDGTEYRKILMYYKLKCFEDGTAGDLGWPCGEWDYLSYTYLFDHTGVLDSTEAEHPQFLIDNGYFEYGNFTTTPLSDYLETSISMGVSNEAGDEFTAGTNEMIVGNALHEGEIYRTQILYTADELIAAGMTAGDITGLNFGQEIFNEYEQLRSISLKNSSSTETIEFDNEGFTEVYYWFEENGVGTGDNIVFNQAFNWDGTSNILINIEGKQFETYSILNDYQGETTDSYSTIFSSGNDRYLVLSIGDNVEVPAEALATIEDEVTIACWVYGDEDILPVNTYLFEGVNQDNQRVLNVHLPWSNSRMYWDAGQDGGYDRIDKAASSDEIAGQWNHWAFTKNNISGEMKIYLNGIEWHSGTDKDNSMAGIVKFLLGSNKNSDQFFFGNIDDFQIWDVELDEATISEWMKRDVTIDHPNYDNLKVYYKFDEGVTDPFTDSSPNAFHGIPLGSPERVAYEPNELFKNVQWTQERTNVTFIQNNNVDEVVESTQIIPMPINPSILTEWYVDGNYIELEDYTHVWIDGTSTTYNDDGDVVVTEETELDWYIENTTLSYFQPPFEVIDRFELGRFITPYGIYLDLEDGWTWVYDVTDFEPLLHGEVELQAGNWQELLDMKFAFIHGTPPRDVIRVENLWNGSFGLTTFDETITTKSIDRETGEDMFKLKATTTGHGNPGCAEFCYNTHSVEVNGNQEWSWEIMQECADNPLRPQGGTWIYDRAGWCPGAPGKLREFELTDLVEGQNEFTVDYNCEYESQGNYVFEAQLISYSSPNFANDVEMEDILAPNKMRVKSHFNPMCNKPIIRIRNTGSTPLTSCRITYGINGNYEVYEWTGNLGFMESEDVEVDYTDNQIYAGNTEELMMFEATVSDPNNTTDENDSNNYGKSYFYRPPVYTYGDGDDDDNRLVIYLQTNWFPNETTYTLYDDDNNIVYERDYFPEAMEAYRDTVALNGGCYLFHVEDSDHDGISFWADDDGNGDVRLRKVTTGNFKTFDDDFGKEILHYFYWDTDLVSVEEEDHVVLPSFQIYPNPSDGMINLKMKNFNRQIQIQVYDIKGDLVYEDNFTNIDERAMKTIDLSQLSQGMYMVSLFDQENRISRRILIND